MLDLNDLASGRIPAITPALGGSLAEAAGVCLESQGHAPGVRLHVEGESQTGYALSWPTITAQARRAWNDEQNATEHGAAGIAVLLADRLLTYTPIEASRKGMGFDYWLGTGSDNPLQAKAILEVSGIRRRDERVVRGRVSEKLTQISQSDSLGLPEYVIVVEFSRPLAEVWEK